MSLPRQGSCRVVLVAAFSLAFAAGLAGAFAEPPAKPVKLTFDTDLGNDVDDAMALAVIHALQSRGECELLCVTLTKDNDFAVRNVDLFNTFYGRGDILVGSVRGGVQPQDGKYIRQVATAQDGGKLRYAHDLRKTEDVPDPVTLLRKTLAAEPDGSVVMVQVGFSTNLAALLDSKPDDISPLDGKALVKKKVRLLSIMAGAFTAELRQRKFKEYNIVKDVPAAQKVFHEWPTPVVASGWEIGHAIQHPAKSMQEDYAYVAHHPLKEAYHYYRGLENDQPTYDLTSVLYAVRPQRGYFGVSGPGRVTVNDDGSCEFRASPNGQQRYLTANAEQVAQVREALALLCSQPPKGR